jgi:hypothetical protein
MVRTTTGAVQGILGSDYDSRRSPDLSPRIETAATLVDDILAKATELGIASNGYQTGGHREVVSSPPVLHNG